jgi:hypothetical protein
MLAARRSNSSQTATNPRRVHSRINNSAGERLVTGALSALPSRIDDFVQAKIGLY